MGLNSLNNACILSQIHNLAANSVRTGKDKTVNSEMQSVSLYLAELLLDRGAELNMADYRGRLPLYFAVEDVSNKQCYCCCILYVL